MYNKAKKSLRVFRAASEVLAGSMSDAIRMIRYSGCVKDPGHCDNQRAKLTFYYHKIEKGLALPQPRPGFGRDWIEHKFLPLLESHYRQFGTCELIEVCCANLEAYIRFNREAGHIEESFYREIEEKVKLVGGSKDGPGGIEVLDSREIAAGACALAFDDFVHSRRTIRSFTQAPVDRQLLRKAVCLATRTPSVCNRQPWHVYAFCDRKLIDRALELQNGNSGFGHTIQALLVVTGELAAMIQGTERNQIWIDCGMYSMTLVYALHSLGVGTCCLNLCLTPSKTASLRTLLGIRDDRSPVMFIGVGYVPEQVCVAQSPRRKEEDVLTWVERAPLG